MTADVRTAGMVLAKIAAIDMWAAKPDAAMALAWAECFAVHDLQAPDLLAGVTALYADDTRDKKNRTLPADVIGHARRIRRNRVEQEKITGALDCRTLSPERAAIAACDLCDPNGYIDTGTAVARCNHNRQIDTRSHA